MPIFEKSSYFGSWGKQTEVWSPPERLPRLFYVENAGTSFHHVPLLHKLQLHSLHKDDLKFLGKTEELQKQKERYRNFGGDIHMKFGLDKCAKAAFKEKKKITSHKKTYTWHHHRNTLAWTGKKHASILGLRKSECIHHQQMKERLEIE